MDDVLTLAQIEAQFASEWVLVEDPQTNEALEVQSGKVRWHSKDRDESPSCRRQMSPKRCHPVGRKGAGNRLMPLRPQPTAPWQRPCRLPS